MERDTPGPPQDTKRGYKYASNLRLAGNLKGKLLHIQGTSDTAVPFSHTMKMVAALIQADKPYDLIILPEWEHRGTYMMETYRQEGYRSYFRQHLKS